GHPIQFDTWLDDLQLYLLSDSRDSVSLFDHMSGASLAPPTIANSANRSQWLTRDTAARLAIRNHMPLAECAHFGQHKTAKALYDAVVARYSSPATAALGRLQLPYLFPELSAFATVEDLVTHLRTSDTRYPAALLEEFLYTNLPPMYITLYFIVTRLPDSLRALRDHFLALDPTVLTVDLLEQHLLAAETSVVAVGAARGTPRTPFFEGMSGLLLLVESAAAARASGSGGSGGSGSGGSRGGAVQRGGSGGGQRQQHQCRSETPSPQQLRDRAGQTCGKPHTQHRCFSRLDDAWRAEFGDEAERPRLAELLRSGVAIFDLDYDAILVAMYALSVSAEGDCYLCVPPDPGIEAAALGASESALPGSAPAEALQTFTLDSDASRCFFRDSTTLTPFSPLVPVRLADPSGGPVLAHSSTILPCLAVSSGSLPGLHLPSFSMNLVSTAALEDAMVTTTTPEDQRVSICTCTRTSRHLATFTRRPGSSLYTLAIEPPQTLLWHHRLGHPSLPRLRGMHSRLLVSGLPRSLPPLPPSPAPPCLPCVERQQRASPHSSFPPTSAPLQTLHVDVWGPARVSGQGRERYFLLVVGDYTRYTTVFPMRSKGEVPDVLIPWIHAVHLQLRERIRQDLPVLRLHSDRGGEFSSDILRDFCRREGILQSFTLPASPQENGIAEHRIGLVMEVARTSMIHAAAPHFLWPFAVWYAAHQLNLWPRVSLPETSSTLRWTGKVGDALVFRVWGSCAFVRDTSVDKLSARAIPCFFLGFPQDTPGWQFYHPTSRCVLPSQDVTFDELVLFYRLFPYRTTPLPPPPLFLAPGPPPVDPLPPQGPALSGAARGPASRGATSRGAERAGAEPGGAGCEGAGSGGAELGGADPGGAEPGGAKPEGAEPGGAESEGAESGGAEPRAAGAGDYATGGTGAGGAGATSLGGAGVPAGAGGPGVAGAAGPGGSRTRGTGAAGVGGAVGAGAGDTGAGGAGAGAAGGTGAAGAGGASGVGAGDTEAGGAGPERVPLPSPHASSLADGSDPESDLVRAACPTVPCLLATVVTDPLFESTAASALVAELVDFAAACRLDYAASLVVASESDCPLSLGGECALGTDVLEDRQEDFEHPDPTLFRRGNYESLLLLVADSHGCRDGILEVHRHRDYELHFLNFITAFLQGRLYEEIWPHRLPGFTRLFLAGTQWSLRRPVYGLRQAPREWHDTLRTTLAALGFAPFTVDPSLFLRTDTSLPPFYVLVYVDDLVFATGDTEALALVLQRFGFRYSSPQTTPLPTGHSLSTPPLDDSVEPSDPYPELVGCLMYVMTCIRPDLAYPLSILARYVAPGRHRPVHWGVAKSVLRYLCSTSGMGLVLERRGPVVLTGYADAMAVAEPAGL
ncbi:unnamed protein product, partial [Closterium sp. NIES-53]